MAFLTGCIVLDAPASALNNAGSAPGATTDNAIVVKKIRVPGGGEYAYVSAQAMRYWIRANLELNDPKWKAAPVRREGKIAYTDADPIKYWDDDLFGYMRAPSQKSDAKKDVQASPLEEKREITRVSPLRISTFTSISRSAITTDFGTMTRQEGNPVPYEHEFYRGHLLGLISLDLSASGTFFDGERVGYKNLDKHRREEAKDLKLAEVTLRKQGAYRLSLEDRMDRVSTLVGSLAYLSGGAKQAVHYTDITPAVMAIAVTKYGNNPFYRLFTAGSSYTTQFHEAAFREMMSVYGDQFLGEVLIGWSHGFLDEERKKLESARDQDGMEGRISLAHPVEQIRRMAESLRDPANSAWYE